MTRKTLFARDQSIEIIIWSSLSIIGAMVSKHHNISDAESDRLPFSREAPSPRNLTFSPIWTRGKNRVFVSRTVQSRSLRSNSPDKRLIQQIRIKVLHISPACISPACIPPALQSPSRPITDTRNLRLRRSHIYRLFAIDKSVTAIDTEESARGTARRADLGHAQSIICAYDQRQLYAVATRAYRPRLTAVLYTPAA